MSEHAKGVQKLLTVVQIHLSLFVMAALIQSLSFATHTVYFLQLKSEKWTFQIIARLLHEENIT